jgi:hypothetical protein
LWRDHLLISLAPDELSWVRLSGVLKPEARDKCVVTIENPHGARSWDNAVSALREETVKWRDDRLLVSIVLSNHFVRYALIPHSQGINGYKEELALAKFHFSKVHGETVRDWDIRLSPAYSGGARLACAIDTALIETLRQLFPQNRRQRLASVQPLLMSAFNSGASGIPEAGAWLLIVEHDRTCVALLSGKTWYAVQNVKGQFLGSEAWVSLVERERWRVNLDSVPDTILVLSPGTPSLPHQSHGAWKMSEMQLRWPVGMQPARDSIYAKAISAA